MRACARDRSSPRAPPPGAAAVSAALAALLAASAAAAATASGADPWAGFLADSARHRAASGHPYAHCFSRSARLHELPEALLVAVARGESAFDPVARSHADAYGLMQIQWPGTAHHLGIFSLRSLLQPCTNVDAGARYLRELLGRYGDDLQRALAAYNLGPSRVPPAPAPIPATGLRYSRYIHRQLPSLPGAPPAPARAAVATAGEAGRAVVDYPVEHELVVFDSPVRADAMASALGRRHPQLTLDTRRVGASAYAVSVRFDDAAEHRAARDALRGAGFRVP